MFSKTFIGSLLFSLDNVLKRRGLDSRQLFEEAGLMLDGEFNASSRIPVYKVKAALQLASKKTKDSCVGLEVGGMIQPTAFHALGFSAVASVTLKDAMDKIRRFHSMLTDASIVEVKEDETQYKLVVTLLRNQNGEPLLSDESVDAFMAALVKIFREMLNHDFSPVWVALCRDSVEPERYTHFFNAPVRFSSVENAICFDKPILNRRLSTGNQEVARINEQFIVEYLKKFDKEDTCTQVYLKIMEMIPRGEPTKQLVADSLGMSVRTLEYRLETQKSSYKIILNEARKELALQYLNDTTMSITEVAYMVGYANPSNFNRAFKRWTGLSPICFRKAQES